MNEGRAVRSFCYIDDAVDATLALIDRLESGDISGRSFNIGRSDPVSIREMADIMLRLSGRDGGDVSVSVEEHFGKGFEEIPYRSPDVSAMEEDLGFKSSIGLEEGLRRTLSYWGLLSREEADRKEESSQDGESYFIPMVKPCFDMDDELSFDIFRSLDSGCVTNGGPLLRCFEKELAGFLDLEEALVVSSGSDALLLSIKALGLEKGKAVLPSFTYMSTLSALVHCGFEPVFCDIDPDSWTMDPDHLSRILMREKVKLILPVNVFGVHADLAEIASLAEGADAKIVYDNAHGFGTEKDGLRAPPEPDIQIFSLHATKILPAVEGGIVLSRNADLLNEVRRLSVHGLSSDPLSSSPGYNAKMSELHAAVGLNSLRNFPEALERRRKYAARLCSFLANECDSRYILQKIPPGIRSNYQNLGVLFAREGADIDMAVSGFLNYGVEAKRYFHPPLHRLKSFGGISLENTESVSASLLCLPLHNRMKEKTLRRVEIAAVETGGALVV